MSDNDNPLDRLTRPGGRQLSDDESIPVLTERLTLPSLDLDVSLPNPPPPVAEPPPPSAAAARSSTETASPRAARPSPAAIPAYPSVPAAPPPEVDWTGIERAVRDAVLAEVQPALADEAARLLRERLQPAIDRAVLALTAELQQAFEARLRETITRAVATEIARLRGRG